MAVFSGNGSTSSPSFTFSSDTDTGFYRYGDGDIGITLNGALRARFEGSALNISSAAVKATAGGDQNLYIADNVSNAGIFVGRWNGAGDGCVNDFFATRGASVGSYTAPTNGDELSCFRFFTHDTTAFREVSSILARVGTYTGTNDVGGEIRFNTRPTGSGQSNREVYRITQEAYLRMASGTGGIQFNGDTTAANALDDYEEGNWTPGNLDADFTVAVARYIKIGRLVHAWFVTVNASTVATYDLPNNVQGLPYVRTMNNPYANYGLLAGTVSVINNIAYSGSQIVWNGVVTGKFNDADGCTIRWKNDTAESAPNLQPQIVNAPTGGIYFDFHVVYEAAS